MIIKGRNSVGFNSTDQQKKIPAIRDGEPPNSIRISLKKQNIKKIAPTSLEELAAGGPGVLVSEGTSETSKNKDKCILTGISNVQ